MKIALAFELFASDLHVPEQHQVEANSWCPCRQGDARGGWVISFIPNGVRYELLGLKWDTDSVSLSLVRWSKRNS